MGEIFPELKGNLMMQRITEDQCLQRTSISHCSVQWPKGSRTLLPCRWEGKGGTLPSIHCPAPCWENPVVTEAVIHTVFLGSVNRWAVVSAGEGNRSHNRYPHGHTGLWVAQGCQSVWIFHLERSSRILKWNNAKLTKMIGLKCYYSPVLLQLRHTCRPCLGDLFEPPN